VPKIIDFPRASLQRSLEAALAVESLGGESTPEMCASKLGRKTGGAFAALLGAAVKFGLLENRKQKLHVTSRFRNYKLAYDEQQGRQVLREAFLSVPLFQRVAERFAGKKIPVDILEKLLIKEFEVPDEQASRVTSYFIDGARQTGLLADDGVLSLGNSTGARSDPDDVAADEPDRPDDLVAPKSPEFAHYRVLIRGPGMNSEIQVMEPEDLLIVEAMLKKVRRGLVETAPEGEE
jgi:hypothetical protein